MYNKAMNTVFALILFSGMIVGCGAAIPTAGTNAPIDRTDIGKVYDLVSVTYTNGKGMYIASQGDMAFQISSMQSLNGNLYCNQFALNVTWGSGVVATSGYMQGTAICPGKPITGPFAFTDTMSYQRPTATQLVIRDMANNFTATFKLR